MICRPVFSGSICCISVQSLQILQVSCPSVPLEDACKNLLVVRALRQSFAKVDVTMLWTLSKFIIQSSEQP
jgi:hypothetical protein